MKKLFVFSIVMTFLILQSHNVFSQKIVVGILSRALDNINSKDYYYTISSMSGSERGLKQAMENKLKRNPNYNWMKDFARSYVGYEGEYFVTIIKYKYKFGVGIRNNRTEALEQAIDRIKLSMLINSVSDYEIIFSEDFSDDMNKPPEKPYLINPKNYITISTTTVNLKWSCNDEDDDELTYEILFGKEGEYLVSIAEDYHSTSIKKTGLLRGKKYNWRVIVSDGKAEKKWTDGSFYTSNIGSVDTDKTKCPVCDGKGKVLVPESYITCTRCNGTGWYSSHYKCGRDPYGKSQNLGCGGSGKVKVDAHWEGCSRCNGTGYIDD